MIHCIVKDGIFIKHIGNEQIDWDETHSCTAAALTTEEKTLFGVVELATSAQPEYERLTHMAIESAPVLVSGKWTQTFEVIAKPVDEQIASINADAQRRILAKWPLWSQANCVDGTYPATLKEQMLADKAAVILESNRLTDLIIAGQPAVPNWPVI